jgi:hypothetical protein
MAQLLTQSVPVQLQVNIHRLVKSNVLVEDIDPAIQEQIQQLAVALLGENSLAQMVEQLEAFVRELLGDNSLIVEVDFASTAQ